MRNVHSIMNVTQCFLGTIFLSGDGEEEVRKSHCLVYQQYERVSVFREVPLRERKRSV